jgi:hypothetical protein
MGFDVRWKPRELATLRRIDRQIRARDFDN